MAQSAVVTKGNRAVDVLAGGLMWLVVGTLGVMTLGVLWGLATLYLVGSFIFDASFWMYGALYVGGLFGALGMLVALFTPQRAQRGYPHLLTPFP